MNFSAKIANHGAKYPEKARLMIEYDLGIAWADVISGNADDLFIRDLSGVKDPDRVRRGGYQVHRPKGNDGDEDRRRIIHVYRPDDEGPEITILFDRKIPLYLESLIRLNLEGREISRMALKARDSIVNSRRLKGTKQGEENE